MILNLKRYPAYRGSGVEPIGEIPEHWRQRALWTISTLRNSRNPGGLPLLSVFLDRGVIPYSEGGGQVHAPSLDLSTYQVVACGDLVLNNQQAWRGSVGVSPYDGIISPAYLVLKLSRALDPAYANYLMRSTPMVDQFVVASRGVGDIQRQIYWPSLRRVQVPVPGLEEQSCIVRYLDYSCRRIQRYIRAKQRLITLLEEQKQAIIYRTVTRGLDPEVRLKASGLDWLGDIPESWAVRRNGQLFAQRNEVGFAELPILEVSLRTGVSVREFDGTVRKQVMADRGKYKRAARGDVVYNMMRMWQGAVGVAPVDGLVSPAYVVARPVPGVDVRYFTNLFRTATYMREVDSRSRGIVKDRNRLYWEDFKQLASPYPAPAEQREIAKAIEAEIQRITAAAERLGREISLVGAYRVRLISDVVTGKLDVRAVAETLSREADDLEVSDDEVFDEIDALAERDEGANEHLAFVSEETEA